MSTTMQTPQDTALLELHDDPDMPGTYLTDGEQLFRVLGSGQPRRGYVEVEDCTSLHVWLVHIRELTGWGMRAVCPHAIAAAS